MAWSSPGDHPHSKSFNERWLIATMCGGNAQNHVGHLPTQWSLWEAISPGTSLRSQQFLIGDSVIKKLPAFGLSCFNRETGVGRPDPAGSSQAKPTPSCKAKRHSALDKHARTQTSRTPRETEAPKWRHLLMRPLIMVSLSLWLSRILHLNMNQILSL